MQTEFSGDYFAGVLRVKIASLINDQHVLKQLTILT